MDLSIVIVTHNSVSPVKKCLESIREFRPSCEYETIVIDNASKDGSTDLIKAGFADVRLVENERNTGYSAGVNQGIKLSKGRHILILNPDIVVREGSIDTLVEFAEKTPEAGIVGAKLIYPDGRLQYSCRRFYTFAAMLFRRTLLGRIFPRARPLRRHLMMDYDHEETKVVDWIIGACMLVRREAIEKVGRMDERFFLYFEDIDWCYRMRNHGWNVYYTPESVMIHSYERSSAGSMLSRPFLIHVLSMLRYYEKWNRIFYFARRHRGAIKSSVFVLLDIAAVNVSFLAAYYARDMLQPFFINKLYPLDWYRYFILFYNLIFFLTFLFGGMYRLRRETDWSEELLRIAKSAVMVLAILMASTYLTRIRIYSRAVLIGQTFISIVTVFGIRRFLRYIHAQLVRGRFDLKRILFVGRGTEVEEISLRISNNPSLGIDVVGYVDTDPGSLGSIEDIPALVDKFKVQEVIVLPSYQDEGRLIPFMMQSRDKMIQVRLVSPLARLLGRRVIVDEMAGDHMFSIDEGVMFLFRRTIKRIIDIIVALVMFPPVSLLSFICFVYGRSTGRLSFSNEARRGRWEQKISWPRISANSGREAPDVVKVRLWIYLLIGRLSLVGPPPPYISSRIDEYGTGARLVRPGITGRWRVIHHEGWRSAEEEEVLALMGRSITGELLILAQSIIVILTGEYPDWFFDERGNR